VVNPRQEDRVDCYCESIGRYGRDISLRPSESLQDESPPMKILGKGREGFATALSL